MTYGKQFSGPKVDHVREIADRLVAMAESGNLVGAMRSTIIRSRAGDGSVPCQTWSFNNQLLTMLAGTEDARGYRQWEQVGRHVVKGAKAFSILAPKMATRTDPDPITGEDVKHQVCVGFLAVPVFRIEDTEGVDVAHADFSPPAVPPLSAVAAHWGIAVEYGPTRGGEYGYYQGRGGEATERIHLSSHDPEVFYHEIAHAAHYRVTTETLDRGQAVDKEVVAEFSAAILAEITGTTATNPQTHLNYMRGYAGDTDKLVRWMVRMMDTVAQVVVRILDAAEQAEAQAAAA